jgi:hypothetical protein
LEDSLAWLQKQGNAVRRINDLMVEFSVDEVEEFAEPGSAYPKQLDALMEYIGENLNLSKLTLSLDHTSAFEYYDQRFLAPEDIGNVRTGYEGIIRSEPLRALGKKGLKAFYVFWVAFHDLEEVAEGAVMGDGYVPPRKLPPLKRCWGYPHTMLADGNRPMDLTVNSLD